jgi:hypothetical protein
MGLRPPACWDCGFEFRRWHGCLSVVNVVGCQLEVCATGRSLVQSIPNDFGVSECDRESLIMRGLWPTGGCCAMKRSVTRPGRCTQRSVARPGSCTQRFYVTTGTLLWCYKLKVGITAQGILNKMTWNLDGLEGERQILKCSKKPYCS